MEDEYFYPNSLSSLIKQTSKRSIFIGPYFVDNIAGHIIIPKIWLDDCPEMLMKWDFSLRFYLFHCTNDRVLILNCRMLRNCMYCIIMFTVWMEGGADQESDVSVGDQ